MNFGDRLAEAMMSRGPVCAGIDPHPQLLAQWGMPDTPAGLREFSLRALDGFARAAAIKPQSAFYERFGAAGIAVLEELLAGAREREILTILDVKRGDIGSTMNGYIEAYLVKGSPLESDAITISPYMGPRAYENAARVAAENGKGLFLLALTSNSEGVDLQRSESEQRVKVAAQILRWVNSANRRFCEKAHRGAFGVVIGATVPDIAAVVGEELKEFTGTILAPGVGAQGGSIVQMRTALGANSTRFLASSSRALLKDGPEKTALENAICDAVEEVRNALGQK
ncbi:MAG: orotidine-5'-phosphate decarboxylase [Actinomycetaceae bacterium]|nr:orotidine-5'-phosphate decarboxylase [Actinomycetaceae bacterium]